MINRLGNSLAEIIIGGRAVIAASKYSKNRSTNEINKPSSLPMKILIVIKMEMN